MNKLEGKNVVITGAGGNVGYNSAKVLAEQGARIIGIVRRNLESTQQMFDLLPNGHLNHKVILASVHDSSSLKNAVANLDILKCDILINCAGRSYAKVKYSELSDEIVNDILDTNVKGIFYTVREFLSLIYKSEEPIIINISSAAAKNPGRANLIYAASKAAVDNMTRCMALNMAPKVRVIGISPGWLDQAMSGAPKRTAEETAIMAQNIPLKRVATVNDVTEMILNVSTGMKTVTGAIIAVDCGVTI